MGTLGANRSPTCVHALEGAHRPQHARCGKGQQRIKLLQRGARRQAASGQAPDHTAQVQHRNGARLRQCACIVASVVAAATECAHHEVVLHRGPCQHDPLVAAQRQQALNRLVAARSLEPRYAGVRLAKCAAHDACVNGQQPAACTRAAQPQRRCTHLWPSSQTSRSHTPASSGPKRRMLS